MQRFWVGFLVLVVRAMAGRELWDKVTGYVFDKESQYYASGEEKRREVLRDVDRFGPESPDWLVNLAIESIVTKLRAG